MRIEKEAIAKFSGENDRYTKALEYEKLRKDAYGREMNLQWNTNIAIEDTWPDSRPSQNVKAKVELHRRESMLLELEKQTQEYETIRNARLADQEPLLSKELERQKEFSASLLIKVKLLEGEEQQKEDDELMEKKKLEDERRQKQQQSDDEKQRKQLVEKAERERLEHEKAENSRKLREKLHYLFHGKRT